MQIHVHRLGGDRLVDDYLAGEDRILRFFAGSPYDGDAYLARAESLDARFGGPHRSAMVEAVHPLGPEAATKLESIAAGNGYFVTTGQQPGLFGGPLYTVHKALSAVVLARRLEGILDAPVLPIFWIASDDHDWAEANHAHLLDPSNRLRRLALLGDPDPPRSMGRRQLGSSADPALDELAQALPASDFTASVLERIRGAYSPRETVASAFGKTLTALFEGLPLGLVDGQDPVVRTLGAEVLGQELENGPAHEAALRERTDRLEAAGYTAQVVILPGASNVFHEDDEHGRERLLHEDGDWVLRASGRRLGGRELRQLWSEEPERFSPNVVLRPVVESAVFPTLAYVAGPGEVRYFAQTGGLFERHGLSMPLVFPRLSVTLLESKVVKVMEKFGLGLAEFRQPVHELITAVVREDVPEPVRSALSALRARIGEGYQAVFEAARAVDPTLKGPIFHARNEAFMGLGEVEKKVRQHVKLKRETDLEQIEKAAANLAPLGKPQERVLNVHQYLARYGDELIPAILEAVENELAVAGRKRAPL
jgi:bacillithiol synthase